MSKKPDDPSSSGRARPVLHRNVTLVQVTDPILLKGLKADRHLGPMIAAEISDRVAIVAPGKSEAFVKRALKSGHTPKVVRP